MNKPLKLDPDRFFPIEEKARGLARALFCEVEGAPIISPHGHTDPAWFAGNENFTNATDFLLTPDHYILRMLYSQGVRLEDLGIAKTGETSSVDPRDAWRLFASHYYLFRGTPSRAWLDHSFAEVFGLDVGLTAETADHYFDHINERLASDTFKPRALLDRFEVQYISTTEGALDELASHRKIAEQGWADRIAPTFRPDDVTDPDHLDFAENLSRLAEMTGENCSVWSGYLAAIRNRRAYFRKHGATATDHGHSTALTADFDPTGCQKLLDDCLSGEANAQQREYFRGQMLTELAGMAREDGMVMQIHPGVSRNHNGPLHERFGPDKGADIPVRSNYTEALQPLLNRHGNDPDFSLILFTLDESNYARELAPLAGHYPCLKLGPPWWFNDSPQGMLRFRRQVTETAGFYNTAGFNDDTRALASIPARHDLARRMDARFLAEQVCQGVFGETEAHDLMNELTGGLVRRAYKLDARDIPAVAAAE